MAKKKAGKKKPSEKAEDQSKPEEETDQVEEMEVESAADESEEPSEDTSGGPGRILRCRESPEEFLSALRAHQDKEQNFDLEESLQSLSPEDMASLWSALYDHLRLDQRTEVVSGVAAVLKMTLSLATLQDDSCPQGLLSSVLLLHDLLPSLWSQHKLANNISQCLETWFLNNLPDKDSVILNSLIFLLRKSLGEQAVKNDVKRVWALHSTLLEQTLSHSGSLTRLVLATAGSSLYLSTSEGVRWLTFLLSISPDLVLKLHHAARSQLGGLNKAGCLALGEVYHKAWLVSGGEFRTRLETDCLQDLMYMGVVTKRQVAANFLKVLSYLHAERRSTVTQNMLARLYSPILWRYLKVANHTVRLNATVMFLEAYPLEDLEQTREERDTSREKQHSFIVLLMRDVDPRIRVEAIKGVCRILALYWQLVSSDFINKVISILFKETVVDSSSPKVRMATLIGISNILSNPPSHVYLKSILGKLSSCIHDTNDGVRAAFLDLLLVVKGLRNIKFWNVCKQEDLVARLEVDKGFVGRKICQLLHNSYFPEDEEKKLERCIHMINMNRLASRRFYQLSAELLSPEESCKFMLSVLSSIKIWIKSKSPALDDTASSGKRKRKLYTNSDSDVMSETDLLGEASTMLENTTSASASTQEGPEENEDHPYNDLVVVGGVLDIVCILWLSKADQLSKAENDVFRNLLEKKTAKTMTLFFKFFKTTPVISPVVYLSSFLPERGVAHVASYCLAKAKEENNWKTAVDSLCNWRKGDDLLELVMEGIKTALAPPPSQAPPTRGVRFEEPRSKGSQLRIGLKLMNYLLDNKTNRLIVRTKNKPMLREVLTECEALKDHVVSRLSFSGGEEEASSEELVNILSIQCQLTVLLQPEDRRWTTEVVAKLEEQLAWAEAELLPVLVVSEDTPARSREQRALARDLLQTISSQVVFFLSSGMTDSELSIKGLSWGLQLLYDGGVSFLPGLMFMLVAAAETAAIQQSEAWRIQYEENIPVCFAKILSWLSVNLERLEEEEEETKQFTSGVKNFLTTYHKLKQKDADSWEDLLDVTIASIVTLLGRKAENQEELMKEQLGKVIGGMLDTILSLAGHDSAAGVVEEFVEKGEEEGSDLVSTLEGYKLFLNFIESDSKGRIMELIQSKLEKVDSQESEDVTMTE